MKNKQLSLYAKVAGKLFNKQPEFKPEITFEQYCAQNQVIEAPTEKQLQAIYNMQRGFKLPIETPATKEQATIMIGAHKHQIAEIKLNSRLHSELYDSIDNCDWEDNDYLDPIY